MKLNVCSECAADGRGEGIGIIARDDQGELVQVGQLLGKALAIQW